MYIENKSLSSWLSYSFTGTETFEEVSDATAFNISSLQHYINHLLCIPTMKLFIKVVHKNGTTKYLISLIVSLECFKIHTTSVYSCVDQEIALCGYRFETIRKGCERFRLNALKECTNIQHSKRCSYFATWLAPFQLHRSINKDKEQNVEPEFKSVEKSPSINKDLVRKMYYKAINLAINNHHMIAIYEQALTLKNLCSMQPSEDLSS
jgi:hypothetical protein